MSAAYQIRAKNSSGILQAIITDFLELAYTKQVNAPGVASFRLLAGHSAIANLEHKGQIEIWRRNADLGIDWYCDFYGFYLDHGYEYTDRDLFTATCPGTNWLLSTRHIMWYAGTADRSEFASEKAETIMKTLVDYNAGANATVGNGRIRNGAITGLSVQADGANGNTLDWCCAWENLLTTLQDLARVAGGDFDLVRTGATTTEFRWYTGQLGTDRTATVIFSVPFGNMANPRYRHNRIEEKTAVVVGGQGEESNRATVIRTGVDYSAANDTEGFQDAKDRSTTAGLNSAGDQYLDENQAREELRFDVLQTPSTLYGSDYFLGDLVTAHYHSTFTQKIVGVSVSFSSGLERISLEMETQ